MGRRPRQQQTRSVVTKERVIDATLDEIFEVGYHAATTQEVASWAGVSRGALLHHFPTRADLMVAAMEALLDGGVAEIREVAGQVGRGEVSIEDFVAFAWRLFSGRFFFLSLEMITESRNDQELRQRMIPVVKRFHAELDAVWSELCDPAKRTSHEASIILNMTLCLVRGMGVQSVLRPEPAYFEELLSAWKRILPDIINGATGDVMFARKPA